MNLYFWPTFFYYEIDVFNLPVLIFDVIIEFIFYLGWFFKVSLSFYRLGNTLAVDEVRGLYSKAVL